MQCMAYAKIKLGRASVTLLIDRTPIQGMTVRRNPQAAIEAQRIAALHSRCQADDLRSPHAPVLRLLGLRFHFYSDEGKEPPHIHVDAGDSECKFWLDPIQLASNHGVAPVTIRKIERLVYEHQALFLEKYREFHGN